LAQILAASGRSFSPFKLQSKLLGFNSRRERCVKSQNFETERKKENENEKEKN
jgi:hypothetical protein